jgi:hypothetical protein
MKSRQTVLAFVALFGFASTASAQQWTSTTPLPIGYQEHILVSANGFLYNIGGVSAINSEADGTNVYYSQVYTNGTIGAWKNTTPLPEAVFDSAGVADNGFVYVIAGNHYNATVGDFLTNIVYYTKINSDGSLGAWQTASPFPQAVSFLGAALWNHIIYAVGGQNNIRAFNNIYSARIQADGSLTAWASQTALPIALDSTATAANGMLYVVGGGNNSGQVQMQTYYSKINSDGTLAGWNRTTDYPQFISNFAGAAAAGRVFCFAGFDGGYALRNCYSAPALGDGSLGAWSAAMSLPQAVLFNAAAAGEGYIFESGGAYNQPETSSSVYSMPLPPQPTSLVLTPQGIGTNQYFQLQLSSSTNTGFGILASTNLTDWTKVGWGFTDTNGNLLFTDTNASNFANRFYRAYWPLP